MNPIVFGRKHSNKLTVISSMSSEKFPSSPGPGRILILDPEMINFKIHIRSAGEHTSRLRAAILQGLKSDELRHSQIGRAHKIQYLFKVGHSQVLPFTLISAVSCIDIPPFYPFQLIEMLPAQRNKVDISVRVVHQTPPLPPSPASC